MSFQQGVIDANAGSLPGRVGLVIPVSMRISTDGGRGLHGWANAGDSNHRVTELPVADEATVYRILWKALGKLVCDRGGYPPEATELSKHQIREAGEIMVRGKTLLLRDHLRCWRAKEVALQAALNEIFRALWKCPGQRGAFGRGDTWQRGMIIYLYDRSARGSEGVVLELLRREPDASVRRRKVVRLRFEQLVAELEALRKGLLAAKFHVKVLVESLLVVECFAAGLAKRVRKELETFGNTLAGARRVLRGDIMFVLRCDGGAPFNCRF